MEINSKYCYLCQKAKPQPYFTKLGYSILRCPNCKLLTLDFLPNYESFIKSYYQEGYFTRVPECPVRQSGDEWHSVQGSAPQWKPECEDVIGVNPWSFTANPKIRAYENYHQDKTNIMKNARKIFQTLHFYKTGGNLLDIGCAMGFFMEEAQKHGFEAFGIEISEYAAKIAQKRFGDNIYLGSIEEFFKKKGQYSQFKGLFFDAIILSDFIEHVKDPRKILQDLKGILKNEGIIVIQTGDTDSLWAKITGKNWHFFAPPQHLYFFSKKTLTGLLSQADYKILKINKEGKQVSLKYIMYMSQYMNIPVIGDKLIKLINNTPLDKASIDIKLFDNMVVYAQKA